MVPLSPAVDDRMPRICQVTSLAGRHTQLIYPQQEFLLWEIQKDSSEKSRIMIYLVQTVESLYLAISDRRCCTEAVIVWNFMKITTGHWNFSKLSHPKILQFLFKIWGKSYQLFDIFEKCLIEKVLVVALFPRLSKFDAERASWCQTVFV